MSITNHVSGTITLESVGIPLENFHTPLLVSYNTSGWGATRKRSYTDLSGVAADFPSTTGPEYLWAQAMFGQSPKPETIAIGRGDLPYTQKFTLVPTVRDSYTYRLNVGGDGVTTTEVEVESGVSATATEICDDLRTAINAITGGNMTGTGTTTLIVTGDAAGEWFWIEVLDPADFTIVEDHVDPGIATDLAAIKVASDDWYALHTTGNSDALVKAAAAWANSNTKLYAYETVETEAVLEVADGTQGTLDDVNALAYNGVLGVQHPRPAEMLVAGAMGRWLAQAPGASVLADKTIAGATASLFPNNSTYRTNLVARKANFYETVGGFGRFYNGAVGGTYLWLDVKRNIDFMENLVQTRLYEAKAGAELIPMDDEGMGILENALRGAVDELENVYKIFRKGTTTVTVPKVADISASDRAQRIVRNLKFAGELTGAVQRMFYTGSVTF
jgi:hypothetical protein